MISVCIASYNGGEMLKTQLESIVSQLSECDEIVISEDGDINATILLISSIKFKNIRVIDGARVGSPIYNFEKCIQSALGDVIFLSDQDDKWCDNKVQIMMDALDDAECVCSDCYVTDASFQITNNSFFHQINSKTGKYYNLLYKNSYLGCCMAFKNEILTKVLPFPRDLPMHDIWIGNVAAFFYRIKFIDDKLIYFRRHGNNSSCTASTSPYSFLKKISFRLVVIRNLMRLLFL